MSLSIERGCKLEAAHSVDIGEVDVGPSLPEEANDLDLGHGLDAQGVVKQSETVRVDPESIERASGSVLIGETARRIARVDERDRSCPLGFVREGRGSEEQALKKIHLAPAHRTQEELGELGLAIIVRSRAGGERFGRRRDRDARDEGEEGRR